MAIEKRDYRLTGPEAARAREKGLATAEWYTPPIPPKRLKALMKRKDGPALRAACLWLGLLAGSGTLAYYSWGTWWALPAFLLYGVIYTTPADSGWHESGHGTLFRTQWLNTAMFRLTGFMTFKNATVGRWGHAHHHSDTIIVGLDPELPVRPPVWRTLLMEFLRLNGGWSDLSRIVKHCFGRLDKQEVVVTPVSQHRIVFLESRLLMLFYLGVIAWAVSIESLLPLMFIGLPTFYGTFLSFLITLAQHTGLCEDVLDHRLNTRTLYMNRFFRFLYWNMNYHIEHHMFPMVPFHALPELHREIKTDCPAPSPSLWRALAEVYAALKKQREDPSYCLIRPLPATARPYLAGPSSPFGRSAIPSDTIPYEEAYDASNRH